MDEILNRYRQNHREDLISCMQEFQDKQGYISENAIISISKHFNLPATKVYGIATFYDHFTFLPVPEHTIKICNGTSCHMLGSARLINETEKIISQSASNLRSRLLFKECECQGICSSGPIIQIDNKSYSEVKPEMVKKLIEQFDQKERGVSDE